MYRGFQLIGIESYYYSWRTRLYSLEKEKMNKLIQWNELIQLNQSKVEEAIDACFFKDGSIDGSRMQENWFPQVKADVFISHSHGDEKLAQNLSKWLYVTLGLKAFVDSDVWGYAPRLEEKLLKLYAPSSFEEEELRKLVSAHVHMMLSVALNQMIDNTECLFFLNTPNSISIDAPTNGTTPSPWIYSEIAMSRLIRKKSKGEHRGLLLESELDHFADRPIRYTLLMDHLTKLDSNSLWDWERKWDGHSLELNDRVTALDYLYELNP